MEKSFSNSESDPYSIGGNSLTPSLFLKRVAAQIRERAEATRQTLGFTVRGRLMQCWCGSNSANHYEVWLHERHGKLEIGAHFEGPAATNRRIYAFLDAHLIEIQSALGPSVWLEEWDRGWTRLYETVPMMPLDDAKVLDVAERVLEFVQVVQPMVVAALKSHKER
jgi:hypothetical protein